MERSLYRYVEITDLENLLKTSANTDRDILTTGPAWQYFAHGGIIGVYTNNNPEYVKKQEIQDEETTLSDTEDTEQEHLAEGMPVEEELVEESSSLVNELGNKKENSFVCWLSLRITSDEPPDGGWISSRQRVRILWQTCCLYWMMWTVHLRSLIRHRMWKPFVRAGADQ